jgi:hypothetical protein
MELPAIVTVTSEGVIEEIRYFRFRKFTHIFPSFYDFITERKLAPETPDNDKVVVVRQVGDIQKQSFLRPRKLSLPFFIKGQNRI